MPPNVDRIFFIYLTDEATATGGHKKGCRCYEGLKAKPGGSILGTTTLQTTDCLFIVGLL